MLVVWLIHAASSREKMSSIKTVGKVVWEQGPFSKLCVISRELVNGVLLEV
jgi:hypothetical protein